MIKRKTEEAMEILAALGLPAPQRNERSALVLLALLDLKPSQNWAEVQSPLMGITPIMDWMREHYKKEYAPNSRETIRRQTIHQFVDAAIALRNPDNPQRPVNSGANVYQIAPPLLHALRRYGTETWETDLATFMARQPSLASRYARERDMHMVPIAVPGGGQVRLTPGVHSELIRDVIQSFGPRFVPGATLLYAGDTGAKHGLHDREGLIDLGVNTDDHGKMPDVILYDHVRDWLLLIEAVTSHGPVDPKRHGELAALFEDASAGLVYVTAFPNRALMSRYVGEIAWETEVWCSSDPTHLIHFNGVRFLGPYDSPNRNMK